MQILSISALLLYNYFTLGQTYSIYRYVNKLYFKNTPYLGQQILVIHARLVLMPEVEINSTFILRMLFLR